MLGAGWGEEAIDAMKSAMRLNLKDPRHRHVTYPGPTNFTAGQSDVAIATAGHKYPFNMPESRSDFR